MNGEPVGINPKHPDGASAKKATDKAFNEDVGSLTAQQMLDKLSKEMQGTHTGSSDPNSDWSKFVLSHKGFTLKDIQVDQIPAAVKSDGMSQANIEKYKKADTSQFPPMVIGNDGYLLDGNHRLQAYKAQGIKTVKAYIGEEVEVSLHGDAKKGYVLSKIEVSGDERNAGQGTKAMQDIVDRMDREGAIIALTPDDAFGGNKNRLIKFYKRFGFVPNKGRNKDFRFRETMIRYPQTNESTVTEAFDNPYPFNLTGPDESQSFVATAQTPNGPLTMEFSSTDFDDFGIDFSVGKNMGKTDAGDEFRVFATVVAMMKKWISTVGIEHVEGFDFGADKTDHASDGRARLYTRFAKQLASKLGWKLEQSTTGNGSTSFFRLVNPKPIPRDDEYWDALEENVTEAAGVGRVVKGVNTTIDVGPDEIIKQVKKYGNDVDRDGKPNKHLR